MKISFISLGCPKNQVDLEYLIGDLQGDGYEIVTETAESDAVIINTCGFIEPAVTEAIDEILAVSDEVGQRAKIIVTGCMVERYKEEFSKELPEVDFFSGVGKLGEVLVYLNSVTGKQGNTELTGRRILANAPYFAYLKISEGCNNRCAYCTIPSIRGNLVSKPKELILAEAKNLIESGVKELIIVSQDTTKYGLDIYNSIEILPLLTELEAIEGDFFIRLMYLNPDGVTEKLIRHVAASKKILLYFEIPIQHASDNMLSAMRRKSDAATVRIVFDMIRAICPEAVIRTTGIVGFPGEQEKDFEEMLAFIKEYQPDFAGFFPYSPEEGTPAAKMDGRPDAKTVAARMKSLQSAQKKNTMNRLKAYQKQDVTCFVEKSNDDFEFILEGRALFQAPEIDGKLFVIDGVATDGYGPYTCRIKKIAYPDIYVELIND